MVKMIDSKAVGVKVANKMKRLKVSRETLASRMGCTSQTIKNLEEGKNGVPVMLRVLVDLDIKLGEL